MNTITISAGQTFSMKYDFSTTDITGWKFFGTVKKNLNDSDANADATASGTASGTSHTLTYTAAQTATLATSTEQTYYIDCKTVRLSDSAVMNIPPDGPDKLVVKPSATRRTS